MEARFPRRHLLWDQWYARCIPAVLTRAETSLHGKGIRAEEVTSHLARNSPRPWEHKVYLRIRHSFQKEITSRLLAQRPSRLARIQHKLSRWTWSPKAPVGQVLLPGWPQVLATRWVRHAKVVATVVPPRLMAVEFRTLHNGWCSSRRCNERFLSCNFCRLGCSPTAEDSIEHYSRCPVVRDFHKRVLGLERDNFLPAWLLAEPTPASLDTQALSLLGCYAVYRTTNEGRYGAPFQPDDAFYALRMAAYEGMSGCRSLQKAFTRRGLSQQ